MKRLIVIGIFISGVLLFVSCASPKAVVNYILSMAVTGQGQVSPAAGNHTYVQNTDITLTATPANNWYFKEWQGVDSRDGRTARVRMTGNKNITAVFETNPTLTVTASPTAGGVVQKQGGLTVNSVATITATPNAGYDFSGWTGSLTGNTNPATLVLNESKTIYGNFKKKIYTLTKNASPTTGGTITHTGTLEHGSNAQITATAGAGWEFTGWTGDLSGDTNPAQLLMDGDKSVTANFKEVSRVVATTEELEEALNSETVEKVYVTGGTYEFTEIVVPSGKKIIGEGSPDYPAGLSARGITVMKPATDSEAGALIMISSFDTGIEDVVISGIQFELPDDYEYNPHQFSFIELNCVQHEMTKVKIEKCTFDYSTAPDKPAGKGDYPSIYVNSGTQLSDVDILENEFRLRNGVQDFETFTGVRVIGGSFDPEKRVNIEGNKFKGSDIAQELKSPMGIDIQNFGDGNETDYVAVNGNTFEGDCYYSRLFVIIANTNNINMEMKENVFGTLSSPLIKSEGIDAFTWMSIDDQKMKNIIFTETSVDNKCAVYGSQTMFYAFPDTNDPDMIFLKYGTEPLQDWRELTKRITKKEDFINIVDNIDDLERAVSQPHHKTVYVLPGIYENKQLYINMSDTSIIGSKSPDYPAELSSARAAGEAVFRPADNSICLEITSDNAENIEIDGLKFEVSSDYEYKDEEVYLLLIGNRKISEENPGILKNVTVENCEFNLCDAPFDNSLFGHGTKCIKYESAYGLFEGITISDNTFRLRDSKASNNVAIDGFGGGSDSNKPLKIINNSFYGNKHEYVEEYRQPSGIWICGEGPVEWDGFFEDQDTESFVEISGNTFNSESCYGGAVYLMNDKDDIHFDFNSNTFGDTTAPMRKENILFTGGLIGIFILKDEGMIIFNEVTEKSTLHELAGQSEENTLRLLGGNDYRGMSEEDLENPDNLRILFGSQKINILSRQDTIGLGNGLFERQSN